MKTVKIKIKGWEVVWETEGFETNDCEVATEWLAQSSGVRDMEMVATHTRGMKVPAEVIL